MEGINAADILGIVFLGYGIIDGYRKGFVKKGILFGISIPVSYTHLGILNNRL